MKVNLQLLVVSVLFALITETAFALDISTRRGITYQNCSVIDVTKEGLRIRHKKEIVTIELRDLPAELQSVLNYNPKKGKDAWKDVSKTWEMIVESARQEQKRQKAPPIIAVKDSDIQQRPNPTPMPTADLESLRLNALIQKSKQQAIARYPDLSVKDSPMNRAFLRLYVEAQNNSSVIFKEPDWPLQLAVEAEMSLSRNEPRREADAFLSSNKGSAADNERPVTVVQPQVKNVTSPSDNGGSYVVNSILSQPKGITGFVAPFIERRMDAKMVHVDGYTRADGRVVSSYTRNPKGGLSTFDKIDANIAGTSDAGIAILVALALEQVYNYFSK